MNYELKTGDRVSYTRTVRKGNQISISARKGMLVSIKGDVAFIRAQNGRLIHVTIGNVRPANQPNALTEAMQEAASEQR
ncbi:hypothetical protein [Halomonas llamarensis]|uniref:Uncharacterized protein n=1 Tax=Halomonas llamarensis TaxID=2945104 RepID=A0ABT0SV46_9GAMM|nr:hypothetical protein [Halomonas llamarensis]MCL7931710.1 hypothetical protein [Halomonas llamarensis]